MSQYTCIILHSKYSKQSTAFINTLESSPVPINVNLLCVDNEDIRKRMLSDNRLEISQVPCVLLISGNNIEKYEGPKASQWLQMMRNNITPPTPQSDGENHTSIEALLGIPETVSDERPSKQPTNTLLGIPETVSDGRPTPTTGRPSKQPTQAPIVTSSVKTDQKKVTDIAEQNKRDRDNQIKSMFK
jgi:hypothetical protein